MTLLLRAFAGVLLLATANVVAADSLPRADGHAPIGIMADHFHHHGEWMFSYRFMAMDMAGNLAGSNSISSEEIVTMVPNRFFGNPGQPPTLRVVPDEMTMQMHMVGLMYAPSDNVTLMAMVNYSTKEMDHTTYEGGVGTTLLGRFTTKTSGIGDSSIRALIRFLEWENARIHGILGVSVPTGDLEKQDQILTPMNTRPTVRVPYPMQLGSGSWDPIIGASYSGFGGAFSWGAQWHSTFRFADNNEDYRYGDEHRLTGWVAYSWYEPVSVSVRAEYVDRDVISGIDPMIVGPVQTADPNRQGGSRLGLAAGINIAGYGDLNGWRLAVEYMLPVAQDLNGPQLEVDGTLMLGVQKSW